MKTAVEWYNSKVIELMTQREQGNIDVLEFRNQLDLLLAQAKEMEKEQREKEFINGYKTRALASDLEFDEASETMAKRLFNGKL